MSNMIIGDDGFARVVGDDDENAGGGYLDVVGADSLRGGYREGQHLLGARGDAYAVLGELMEKSPALKQYVEKRIGASRPVIHKTGYTKAQDWQIDFGPVFGTAGSSTTIAVNPQCLFRGEKVMATDSNDLTSAGAAQSGTGTRVGAIFVGNQLQRPAATRTLTAFFAPNALGNGIKWATCQKGLLITIDVFFITACTFDMTVYGKAVL